MSSGLPEFVDPWRLADRERRFSDAVQLSELPRLCGALLSESGEAAFRLEFMRDEKRRVRIKGNVSATLVVQCQRCLGALQLDVDSAIDLAVIEVEEEAERLPEECDPVVVEEGLIRLLDIVEDELILALPQVAMHDPGECTMDFGDSAGSGQPGLPENSETTVENPFAVLARLKSTQDS